MEIKKRFNLKLVLVGVYFAFFAFYIIYGLQPAEARDYDVSAQLNIPSINLSANVTTLSLSNHKLETPDEIVGSYSRAENKTLLIGHSTTIFDNLDELGIGEEIYYEGKNYITKSADIYAKADIDMVDILAAADSDTLVLMTCAGESLGGGDATHRLIIVAEVI